MTTLREAAQQALEALQNCANGEDDVLLTRDALAALRAALAEPVQEPATLPGPGLVMCPACCSQFDPALNRVAPVQEPVAWRFEARHIDSAWAAAVTLKHPGPEGVYMRNVTPLYTAPPQRPAEPVQQGCAHCNHPLYAAVKCKVCGRAT